MRTRASLAVGVLLFVVAFLAACQRVSLSPPATAAEFDRSTSGMTRTQTATFVLDTYGCGRCHTVDDKGNMGFTSQGEAAKELTACCKGGTMCVRLLTVANTLSTVPEQDRSPDEQKMFRAFDEFGCSFCHRIEAGKTGFTDIGRRLGFLHLGCVELQHATKSGM